VQALPHTLAAQTLLSNSLALLLDGSLLPPAAGSTAATAAGEAQAAAVLACLAAGPPGGRLSAMLSAALGLAWADSPAVAAPAAAAGSAAAAVAAAATPAGRTAKSRKSGLLLGGTASSAEAGGPECEGDDVACSACGSRDRADAMLLCDGCEAGLHMDCLAPALTEVPQGDWLCPACCEQVCVLMQ
jgi:hypothetical protein